ncbi:MAG TPA: tetratricopeptide repeat protein, partial [Actinomycetota bacterium]|nr:tetratricopeptide repeat protein [Actinomycetota bacterium]
GAVASALQAWLRRHPDDSLALARLGLVHLQRARLTADPSYYPRAEEALERAISLRPDSYEATLGLGALALARHDFRGALALGRRAHQLDPHDEDPYGVIGDALLELGRYRRAFAAFQRMVDRRPGTAAYARVSYARELEGDVTGALRAMRMALAAAGAPPDAAWAASQLGDLRWNTGRVAAAARAYRRSLASVPGYPPALAGLAKVAWAEGRPARSARLLRRAVRRYPMPEYVVALGDLAAVSGRPAAAERWYDLARAERRLFRASGVNVDLELALFDADHGAPRRALRAARAEWRRRQSIHVADALAWALFGNGRYRAADRYARLALRLGTRNALFLYHAGMIRLGLGDRARARTLLSGALALNPWFSFLHAGRAARVLERLGGPR